MFSAVFEVNPGYHRQSDLPKPKRQPVAYPLGFVFSYGPTSWGILGSFFWRY